MTTAAAPPPQAAGASRARLFGALPRWSATAIALRNTAYASPAVLLSDERILIWQDPGRLSVSGELNCQVAGWPLALAADNLSGIEPRLEGLENHLPAEMLAALVEHALHPVLSLLERLAGVPVEGGDFVRGPAPGAEVSEVKVGFVVLERTLQPLLRGWVRTSPEAWQTMDFTRPPGLASSRINAVPVRLSLRLGQCRLPWREVAALQTGDALRLGLPAACLEGTMPVHLTDAGGRVGAGFRIQARATGDELTLEHVVNTTEDYSGRESSSAATAPAAALGPLADDIECDVAFEVATLRMSVAEVARLRAGQALRMGVRLQEQPIRILVNGRLMARGELAVVGDELVVVVTDTSRLPQV
jgi:type III secretion system YscQ/HrcQ family protein